MIYADSGFCKSVKQLVVLAVSMTLLASSLRLSVRRCSGQ